MLGAVLVALIWAASKFALARGVTAMNGEHHRKKHDEKTDLARLERMNTRLLNALVFTVVLLVLSWVGFLRYEHSLTEDLITIEVEESNGHRENSGAAWGGGIDYNHSDCD